MTIKQIVFSIKRKKWTFTLNSSTLTVDGTKEIQVERAVIVQGLKGDIGSSAYQIAVKNGFVGTELEWLASLKGDESDSTFLYATTNW